MWQVISVVEWLYRNSSSNVTIHKNKSISKVRLTVKWPGYISLSSWSANFKLQTRMHLYNSMIRSNLYQSSVFYWQFKDRHLLKVSSFCSACFYMVVVFIINRQTSEVICQQSYRRLSNNQFRIRKGHLKKYDMLIVLMLYLKHSCHIHALTFSTLPISMF